MGYISQTSLLVGFLLGLANGRHWRYTKMWGEGRNQGVSPPPSLLPSRFQLLPGEPLPRGLGIRPPPSIPPA